MHFYGRLLQKVTAEGVPQKVTTEGVPAKVTVAGHHGRLQLKVTTECLL